MRRKHRSLGERLRLYEEVMRLRRLGLGYKRIAKAIEEKYGVSLNPVVICSWVKGRCNPLGRCNKIIEGPGLAYAVSAWLGDGSLARNRSSYRYYVVLEVSDYDFAEEWGRCLAEALGRSKPYMPIWDNKHKMWVVRGSSLLLYNLLKRAKEDPWILMPYLEQYPAEACRGFFDAEGEVNATGYEILAYNTDLRIVQLFKTLLEKIGIECSIRERRYKDDVFICPSNGKRCHRNKLICYRLAVHGKENILRFAEEVGFIIARKRAELSRILEKYNRTRIRRERLEKCARVLIATNLVGLGLVRTQTGAAKLLSIGQSTIGGYLCNKKKMSKLLRLPEIERLSKEYFYSRSDAIITMVREILQAIIEMYGG